MRAFVERHDFLHDIVERVHRHMRRRHARNFENSSSICLRLPTSLTITWVDSSQIRSKSGALS